MRFGVCNPYKNAAFIQACGYDYIEPFLFEMVSMTDEAFETCLETLAASGIKAEVCNGFFPGHLSLVGPHVDFAAISEYVDKAIVRANALGSKMLVLGSGGSRNIKEAYDRAACEEQFIAIAREIGKKMEPYGMRLVIEPLNRYETNFINTVPEGAEIARRIGCDNVKTMVDFFHHSMVGGTDKDILSHKEYIGHIHVASNHPDRHVPREEDREVLLHWADIVRQLDCHDRVSIEGIFADFAKDVACARECIRVFEDV